MRKEDKTQIIENLVERLGSKPNFYLVDAADLNAAKISSLRRECFNREIQLVVVKNTLLRIAMEKVGFTEQELFDVLEGPTAIMFAEAANAPAKLIKEFRDKKNVKPILKAAYVQECVYVGDDQVAALINVKSRDELIGDIIGLLQSPAKNVVSALKSGGGKLAGIVKALEERAA